MWRPKLRVPRSLRSAAPLALMMALWSAALPAQAADSDPWRIPSRPHTSNLTLHAGGIPAPLTFTTSGQRVLEHEGVQLYATHCASCHGADLRGTHGAPSLKGAGGAAADFYLTTGRMPLAVRSGDRASTDPLGAVAADGTQAYHGSALFDPRQIAALDAFIARHAYVTAIPRVRIEPATLRRGRQIFENNCEMCHGAGAQGATVGYGWTALPLRLASPTQIGEAIRVGPGVMPRFSPAELSDHDLSAVATYVHYLTTKPQDYGGTVLGYVGPAAEGAIGAFGGVGLLFWVVYYTGTKIDGRRVHEFDERDERT